MPRRDGTHRHKVPVSLSEIPMKEEFLLSSLISDVIIKHTRHVLANLKCPLVQTCAVGNICFEVNPSKRACYWLFSADT